MAYGFAPRGVGDVIQVVGAAPAAGAEYSLTVPAGEVWRVNNFTVQLVTNVNAVIRTVQVVASGGAGEEWCTGNTVTQAASLTNRYSFAIGNGQSSAVIVIAGVRDAAAALPDSFIGPGGTIGTTTDQIQAGDQYGSPAITYQRWRV